MATHGRGVRADSLLSEEFSVPAYGALGRYRIEGDECYGLFLRIAGKPVLVDLREDRWIRERERFAIELSENPARIEERFSALLQSSALLKEGRSARIISIGLYNKEDARFGDVAILVDGADDRWICDFRDWEFTNLRVTT